MDLLFFFLLAVVFWVVVQYAGISLFIYMLHRAQPDLDWSALAQHTSERIQYNAFFLVPTQVVYYGLLLLLLLLLVRRRGLGFSRALVVQPLGGRQLAPVLLLGMVLALLIQMANWVFPPPVELPFDRLLTDRAAALLILTASLLVAPLVEELVFRGYVYTVLEPLWGVRAAVLASGVLFGAIHFPQLWPGYFQMASLCAVGIAFSWTRARLGSTTAAIAAHFAYNATISALFLASPQFRQLPAWLG